MKYKHIHFTKTNLEMVDGNKHWACRSNKTDGLVGFVEWDESWQKYAFVEPYPGAAFSAECLIDIAAFLLGVTNKRRAKVAKARKPDGPKEKP